MLKYTIKRLLVAIPTFFGITVLVYLISLLAPGSPLEMLMADPMATKESMEALKEQMVSMTQPSFSISAGWYPCFTEIWESHTGTACRFSDRFWKNWDRL